MKFTATMSLQKPGSPGLFTCTQSLTEYSRRSAEYWFNSHISSFVKQCAKSEPVRPEFRLRLVLAEDKKARIGMSEFNQSVLLDSARMKFSNTRSEYTTEAKHLRQAFYHLADAGEVWIRQRTELDAAFTSNSEIPTEAEQLKQIQSRYTNSSAGPWSTRLDDPKLSGVDGIQSIDSATGDEVMYVLAYGHSGAVLEIARKDLLFILHAKEDIAFLLKLCKATERPSINVSS